MDYVINLRINRAKELLNSDLYSVSQVAEMSGFFDDTYFSRYFKKRVGKTPNSIKRDGLKLN